MSLLLNFWMLTFALSGVILGIESATLRFYHGSLFNYTETPVEEPLRLLPFFDRARVSMFYIFGYNETVDSEDATLMLTAYLKTDYTNVMLLDWTKEAHAPFADTRISYAFSAVPNSIIVGRELGQALVQYIKNGISQYSIHVVAHSLGAQVAGYAGEFVNDCNLQLARITGLDPAGPLFDGNSIIGGLSPSKAMFVDVIHTNPGLYGISKSIGSVDFWMNCGDEIQPGCPKNPVTDAEQDCSHWRSYKIFAEAIMSPYSILAVKAESCTDWKCGRIYSQTIYLGDLVDTRARGNFYFSTKSNPPFSKGRAGLVPNSQNSY